VVVSNLVSNAGGIQMSVEQSLSKAPFNLSVTDIAWVRKTRDGLSTEAKIRQLFVHITMSDDEATARKYGALAPGGIHRFMGPDLEMAWKATRLMLEMNEIPLFITGDIEGGGHGSGAMLRFPNQIGMAAANDLDLSRRVLDAVCSEAKALGFNWSFTPVVDVSHETGSAIVGTRSYGSDVEKIIAQARIHINTLQSHGIAATAKHWPGEGFDQRDQHLVGTINPLSLVNWQKIFGRIYKSVIDDGVMTVMSAHIALPAYAQLHGIAEGLERYRPASVSKLLNHTLLREELGFNGLVVSDATPMAGLTSWSPRSVSAPEIIENGCDVFLFSTHEERDYQYMVDGLRDGRLSEQRLNDAVTRILALKAALGLNKKSLDERLPPLENARNTVKNSKHLAVAKEAAEKSITLVKDIKHNLPFTLSKHKRITIVNRGAPGFVPEAPRKEMTVLIDQLKSRGFLIANFDPENPPTSENTDLLLYVFAVESSLGLSHIYINWMVEHPSFKTAMERYWHDVPTVIVSLGHPYYLRDAPRVPTYINAYSTIDSVQQAVVECLLGERQFTGQSPVDAFAGTPDAQY
jgi:beta-N-acetylhexosaminidase